MRISTNRLSRRENTAVAGVQENRRDSAVTCISTTGHSRMENFIPNPRSATMRIFTNRLSRRENTAVAGGQEHRRDSGWAPPPPVNRPPRSYPGRGCTENVQMDKVTLRTIYPPFNCPEGTTKKAQGKSTDRVSGLSTPPWVQAEKKPRPEGTPKIFTETHSRFQLTHTNCPEEKYSGSAVARISTTGPPEWKIPSSTREAP